MSELKPCPFCGEEPATRAGFAICINDDCEQSNYWSGLDIDDWNTRPIEDALNARIAELEAELTELKERFDITDGLLNQATVLIGAVIACCTYNSNAEAMAGAYGISDRAFTMIDNFIKNYNRAVLDGKISTDGTLSSQSGAIGR